MSNYTGSRICNSIPMGSKRLPDDIFTIRITNILSDKNRIESDDNKYIIIGSNNDEYTYVLDDGLIEVFDDYKKNNNVYDNTFIRLTKKYLILDTSTPKIKNLKDINIIKNYLTTNQKHSLMTNGVNELSKLNLI